MSANAQVREENFDPALLMAGIDACAEGMAVVGSGRILYANVALARAAGRARPVELLGRLLSDVLPPHTKFADSDESKPWEWPNRIAAYSYDFEECKTVFQLVRVRANPPSTPVKFPVTDFGRAGSPVQLQSELAHDFGNLLTGILLYSDLLIAGLKEETRMRRHAEAIRRSGNDGVKLIEQLIAPVRGELIGLQPSSFSRVAAEIASYLSRLVGDNIDIQFELSHALGLVNVDSLQIHQIIVNLVTNARDAMPSGGEITLASRNCAFEFKNSVKLTTKQVASVEFSVTDNGTGMDKGTLAKVFRPFFTTKPRDKGNGLGLAMVQRIVKEAGGEVEIESEPGKGTRVTLRMPRTDIPNKSN